MKVFDLRCVHTHRFEGWFVSSDEFDRQTTRGLVRCPQCDSPEVQRVPTAARLNLAAARPDEQAAPQPADPAPWLSALRTLIAVSEDVGSRFAEEARRIHYGESGERAIRGVATRSERDALEDEGIEVFALPAVMARKEPLQ